jgi:antirestriction protein ArdC
MPETPQLTESAPADSADTPKRDFRQEVTNQIIEMLGKGTAPWQKPWEAGTLNLPFNPTTDRAYRGGNALHLMAVEARKGYQDPRWLTYKQAQENGWQVRKGEKGSQIEFWQFDAAAKAAPDQEDNSSSRDSRRQENPGPIHRIYTVFNASQIDGIPSHVPKQRQEWEVVETGESILRNSGAQIRHDQRDRAFYNRAEDAIHLPSQEAFKSAADYYGTALHELSHWSGAESRLNRPTLTESYRFGDPNYAKEELRAELASVFLAAERGIPHNPEQHAAYVGTWIQALQNDKNEIFRAAKDAHKAADFILSLERSKADERAASQLRTETSEHVADFERGSGTVDIVEKETATEHREPVPGTAKRTGLDKDQDAKIDVEKILDGEVDGRKAPSHREFDQSLSDADRKAKQILGDHARVYEPDTESGSYRGAFLTESEHHVVQRLSPRSAVAHSKHLLPQAVQTGQDVIVSYSNGLAQLKPNKAREQAQALSR